MGSSAQEANVRRAERLRYALSSLDADQHEHRDRADAAAQPAGSRTRPAADAPNTAGRAFGNER
jgi:hypothetical protein